MYIFIIQINLNKNQQLEQQEAIKKQQEATVRTGHETTDWFQTGKGVHQGCHPAYLTSMQSTSCKMPCWMKHKLESSLQGEISITSDLQMAPPLWQKVKKN